MSESSERERFLAALAKNEDDTPVRMAFADWLDERGEHEEANRHRRWPAAKQWIVDLCEKQRPVPNPAHDPDGRGFKFLMEIFMTYEMLMACVSDVASMQDDVLVVGLGGSEWLCNDLSKNREKFWENWSIVTGIPLPTARIEKACFVCSC